MRLSEAIRVGAKIRPQARGTFNRTRHQSWLDRLLRRKPQTTSCAWAAALEAANCPYKEITVNETSVLIRDGYSEMPPLGSTIQVPECPPEWAITEQRRLCPQCEQPDLVIRLIPHLNDDHAWTREAIAVWIETIEASTIVEKIKPTPTQTDWPDVVGG